MNANVEKICVGCARIATAIRAFIAEKLIEASIPIRTSRCFRMETEVSRRCEEIDSGASQLRDAESVFEKAAKALS
jgi:hypothetical protein